jgi:hypothetical protein
MIYPPKGKEWALIIKVMFPFPNYERFRIRIESIKPNPHCRRKTYQKTLKRFTSS